MVGKYCRHCDNKINGLENTCPVCKGLSPGIESFCPICRSEKYVFHNYGFSGSRALGGALLAGPMGILAGVIGSSDIECICLDCGQGWLPFTSSGPSKTKKFSKLPDDCL